MRVFHPCTLVVRWRFGVRRRAYFASRPLRSSLSAFTISKSLAGYAKVPPSSNSAALRRVLLISGACCCHLNPLGPSSGKLDCLRFDVPPIPFDNIRSLSIKLAMMFYDFWHLPYVLKRWPAAYFSNFSALPRRFPASHPMPKEGRRGLRRSHSYSVPGIAEPTRPTCHSLIPHVSCSGLTWSPISSIRTPQIS